MAVILASGCAAQFSGALEGSLQIDAVPFTPIECRTAQRYGLIGVELVDASGRRVRATADQYSPFMHPRPRRQDVPVVTVLEPGTSSAQPIAACGQLTLEEQWSKIVYRNVEGAVDLACTSPQHTVTGHVDFESCH